MKLFKITYTVIALLLFSACNTVKDYDKFINGMVPKQSNEFAKTFLTKFHKGDFNYTLDYFDKNIKKNITMQQMKKVHSYFPAGKLLATKLIGVRTIEAKNFKQTNLSYELKFSNGWAVASIALFNESNKTFVRGFNITRIKTSLKNINKFSLKNKNAIHYIILVLAIAIPLFIIITFIMLLKTPIKKRKWFWGIFILIGIGGLSFNWTTNQIGSNLLHFQLLGAGFVKYSPYSPAIFTISIPLGAILFWFKRASVMQTQEESN